MFDYIDYILNALFITHFTFLVTETYTSRFIPEEFEVFTGLPGMSRAICNHSLSRILPYGRIAEVTFNEVVALKQRDSRIPLAHLASYVSRRHMREREEVLATASVYTGITANYIDAYVSGNMPSQIRSGAKTDTVD